ncbi:hypothetical protein JCM6882_003323 [Rhodosporidiobolus microsporus]
MTSLLTPPHSTSPPHYHSATDEAAAFVASSALPRRPSLSLPDAKRPRSSLAHRRPSLPHASSTVPPPAPQLDAPQAHCPTPVLTPEAEHDATVGVGAAAAYSAPLSLDVEGAARPAGPLRAATLPASHPASAGFIRRDDLTARAIAKAAAMQQQQQQKQQGQGVPSATAAAGAAAAASEKDRFVNGLVGASVLAIESIWGPSSSTSPSPSTSTASSTAPSSSSSVLPLHWFVKEVLRRSRTSCSTLQLALYYLHKSRRDIRDAVARAEASRGEIVRLEREIKAVKAQAGSAFTRSAAGLTAYPSPPHSPSDSTDPDVVAATATLAASVSSLGQRFTALLEAQNSPVLCGRRMFLAALISASKYLQDRNYSNRAWAKISGLEVREVNRNERAFLRMCGFCLHLKAEDFQRWTERLSTLTATSGSSTSTSSPPAPAPTTLSSLSSLPLSNPAGLSLSLSPALLARHGLARSSSEYAHDGIASSSSSAFLTRPTGLAAGGAGAVAARAALSRGASLPAFAAAASAPVAVAGARERGFPIAVAQPREVAVSPASTTSPSASSSSSDNDAPAPSAHASVYGRKLRALPSRSGGAHRTGVVPASWGAGGGVVPMVVDSQGVGEGVRAH